MQDGTGKHYKKKGTIVFFTIILCVAILTVIFVSAYKDDGLIKGVNIEELDVSGMEMSQAREAVEKRINERYGDISVKLLLGSDIHLLKLSELGYSFKIDEAINKAYMYGRTGDIFQRLAAKFGLYRGKKSMDVQVVFDHKKLYSKLVNLKKTTRLYPMNARLHYNGTNIRITGHRVGREMDIGNNQRLLEKKLFKKDFSDFTIIYNELSPEYTSEYLMQITGVISMFKTTFRTSEENRSDNIRLACKRLDGTVIRPGETFSMNMALGERKAENGYKEAPVILKNELVDGIGGGVCQVTTTLYNAVLLGGLKVIERSPHSIPLGYVKPGQDATISGNEIDFKFQNDSASPVYISADATKGTIYIRLLSKIWEDGRKIRLVSKINETIPPENDKIEIDDTLLPGEKVVAKKARNGIRSSLYRETYTAGGGLCGRELVSKDYYRPVQGIVKINSLFVNYINTMEYLNE